VQVLIFDIQSNVNDWIINRQNIKLLDRISLLVRAVDSVDKPTSFQADCSIFLVTAFDFLQVVASVND
jgi:hypothetical protein